MKRGSYQAVTQRNAPIVEHIQAIKADHPFWGYRRVWAHLNDIDAMTISQNLVHRLMQANTLLVAKNMKLKATRRVDTRKPQPTKANQWGALT